MYLQEAADLPAYSLRAQRRRHKHWRRHYNCQRPHEGIGMRVSAKVYRKSRRRAPRRLKHFAYKQDGESRLAKGHKMISLEGRSACERGIWGASGTEKGWPRSREVYFGKLLIASLHDTHGVISKSPKNDILWSAPRFPSGSLPFTFTTPRSRSIHTKVLLMW